MAGTNLPEPLSPADCDLRDFAFMPLDTGRLLDSDMFAIATGDEFKAALTLWCKAWQQVPAGSLPADDRVLAHLSGAGSKWAKLKAMALRGFVECSDGRLYHPIVCEKAISAWERRGEFQEKKANKTDRQKRWRDRVKELGQMLRDAGVTPPMNASLAELERLLDVSRGASEQDGRRLRRQLREGEGDSSVTNVTGAAAPIDPKKALFDAGVALLGEAGLSTKSARGLIAKWSKAHGEEATNAALLSAAGRAEPVSWIEARLRTKVATDDEAFAASRATAERYRRMAIPGPPADPQRLREVA